jgi:hypothetical protein
MSGLLSSAYVVGFNFKHFVIVIFMFKFTDNVFGGFLVMSLSGFDIRLLLASQSQQKCSLLPVAHACNPSCSGVRDQEDHGLKPARAK